MPFDPAEYLPREGYVDPWVVVKYLLYSQKAAHFKLRVGAHLPVHRNTLTRWWQQDTIRAVGPFKAKSRTAKDARKRRLAHTIEEATFGYVELSDILRYDVEGLVVMPRPLPKPRAVHRIHPEDREQYAAALRELIKHAKSQTGDNSTRSARLNYLADVLRTTPAIVQQILRCERRLSSTQVVNAVRFLDGLFSSDTFRNVRLTTTPWG